MDSPIVFTDVTEYLVYIWISKGFYLSKFVYISVNVSSHRFDLKKFFIVRIYILTITHFFWYQAIKDVSGTWLVDDSEHIKTSNGLYIFGI